MEKKKIITYQLICIALMVVVLVLVLQIMPDKNETRTENEAMPKKEAALSVMHSEESVRRCVPQKAVSKGKHHRFGKSRNGYANCS